MNLLVVLLFGAVFTADYLSSELDIIPRYVVLLPELLSGIAALLIVGRVLAGKRINLDGRYALVSALLIITLLVGIVAQRVPSGAVVAGLRENLRFIPFLLLPAVYDFSLRQLKVQLIVLMGLMSFQVPLVVYQRFVQYGDRFNTGDYVTGPAATSGALSLLMVCLIAAIVVLYLRKKIGLTAMLLASAFFFLPTTLNETKATLVFLPICMVAPILFMPSGSRPLRRLMPVLGILFVSAVAFVNVYDYFIQFRQFGEPVGSFFLEGKIQEYLYKGTAEGVSDEIGRLDSIEIAVRRLSDDPLTVAFGLGAGNVSESVLTGFSGSYATYYKRYGVGMTQITKTLWELGVAGLIVFVLFFFFVFQDAVLLARSRDIYNTLGQIWVAVVVVITLSLGYKNIFGMDELVYVFSFYSGVVAANSWRVRRTRRARLRQSTASPGLGQALPKPASASVVMPAT